MYALGSDPPVNDRMVKKSGQRVWKEGQNFLVLTATAMPITTLATRSHHLRVLSPNNDAKHCRKP